MDVMFLEELADLKDKYPSRLALHHVLSREQRIAPLLSGRIDAEKLQALLGTAIHSDDVDEWFLCGPFELVQLCRDTLADARRQARARPLRAVHLRQAGPPGGQHRPAGGRGRVQGNVQDHLQARRAAGRGGQPHPRPRIHPQRGPAGPAGRPFACAGGVCGTCRAKVVTGAVTMDENYALEQDELDKGYVLTCQSHPTTPEVTVDFDV